MAKIFGIVEDILIVGYDASGADHDRTVCRILQICKKENLKLIKDKCHFKYTIVPFF